MTASAQTMGKVSAVTARVSGGQPGDRVLLVTTRSGQIVQEGAGTLDASGAVRFEVPAPALDRWYGVRLPANAAHGAARVRVLVSAFRANPASERRLPPSGPPAVTRACSDEGMALDITLPRKAGVGDKVAVLSPSFAAPGVAPAIHEQAMRRIVDVLGLVPVEYPTTRRVGASAEDRAADLNAAFRDPEIRAVLATIGGDDQITVVPAPRR